MIGRKNIALTALIVVSAFLCGCVERTISITSDPPGALVWLNDREVGRTPIEVEFLHYGKYDVRLRLNGYESMLTFGDANPPWWDGLGADFFAEIMPADLHSQISWHYVLEPINNDLGALIERANNLRSTVSGEIEDD